MSSDAIYDQAFGGLIDVRRLGSDPDPDEIRTVADELLSDNSWMEPADVAARLCTAYRSMMDNPEAAETVDTVLQAEYDEYGTDA